MSVAAAGSGISSVVDQFQGSAKLGGLPQMTIDLCTKYKELFDREKEASLEIRRKIAQTVVTFHTQYPLKSRCHITIGTHIQGAEIEHRCCSSTLNFSQLPIFKSFEHPTGISYSLKKFMKQLLLNGKDQGRQLADTLRATHLAEINRQSNLFLTEYRALAKEIHDVFFRVAGYNEGNRVGTQNTMQFVASTFNTGIATSRGMMSNQPPQPQQPPGVYNHNSSIQHTHVGQPQFIQQAGIPNDPVTGFVRTLYELTHAIVEGEKRLIEGRKNELLNIVRTFKSLDLRSQGIIADHFVNVETVNRCCTIEVNMNQAVFQGDKENIEDLRKNADELVTDFYEYLAEACCYGCCGPSSKWQNRVDQLENKSNHISNDASDLAEAFRKLSEQFDIIHRAAKSYAEGRNAGKDAGRKDVQEGMGAGVDVAAQSMLSLAQAAKQAQHTLGPVSQQQQAQPMLIQQPQMLGQPPQMPFSPAHAFSPQQNSYAAPHAQMAQAPLQQGGYQPPPFVPVAADYQQLQTPPA